MPITITVSGSAQASFPPEQADISLSVTAQGPDRAAVAQQVAGAHAELRDQLTGLASAGSVSSWSSGNVSTYSYRPYDEQQNNKRLVHVASVAVDATFVDLDTLSPAVDRWLADPLLTLGHIEWDLSESNRTARAAEVRRSAVEAALVKAQSYADALGAGSIEPIEIADAGMLRGADESSPGGIGLLRSAGVAQGAAAAGPGVELRPTDITIGASVHARFIAER